MAVFQVNLVSRLPHWLSSSTSSGKRAAGILGQFSQAACPSHHPATAGDSVLTPASENTQQPYPVLIHHMKSEGRNWRCFLALVTNMAAYVESWCEKG